MSGILTTLTISTLMGLSSNHWIETWICLEVNSLVICLIISNDINENNENEETTFIYLVTQILGSIVMLSSANQQNETTLPLIIITAISLKMGVWPLHLWYANLLSLIKINQNSIVILITWQNILPLAIITLPLEPNFIVIFITLAVISIVSPLQNIKSSSSINSIIIVSSVNNNGWFIISLLISINTIIIYISIYSSALILIMNQSNFLNNNNLIINSNSFWVILTLVCNISGLPPLSLFWGNIIVINSLISFNSPSEILLVIILVTCLFLYNYLWISLNEISLLTNNSQQISNISVNINIILITTSTASIVICLSLNLT